jgi:ParB family transcriptional regulator, chromosome partitioning protein
MDMEENNFESKTLQEINVKEISANPHNPRLVFDQEELDSLKGSISKVGILVPLTVYKNTKNHPEGKYIILDGERRWRCAKFLGLEKIPANIIDEPKDITQNILFMFNIHHFKQEWALFPTALKLEVIMKKLDSDNEKTISDFTGVSRSTIRRCKRLLWYPEKYRDILMDKSGRISTDFFIEFFPIAQRLSYEDKYDFPDGISKLTDDLINIFNEKTTFVDVKQFRLMKKSMSNYDKNNNISEFIERLDSFIENKDIEIFESHIASEEEMQKDILKKIIFLNETLEKIDFETLTDIIFENEIKKLNNKLNQITEIID